VDIFQNRLMLYFRDAHLATELSNAVFEPLCEAGRLGQYGKSFALHGFAMRAGNPAILERKIDAG